MVSQDPCALLQPRHAMDRMMSATFPLQGIRAINSRIASLPDEVGLSRRCRFRYPQQVSGDGASARRLPLPWRKGRRFCLCKNPPWHSICRSSQGS